MAIDTKTDALAQAIEGIRTHLRAAGDAANASFDSDTRLVSGFETVAQVRQFSFTVDEPENLGGTDKGPNPVELVLAALGTCQEIVYATYARVLGIPIESIAVKVNGSLDPRGFFGVADVPAGFREVTFDVEISSPASAEEVDRLFATVNEHCPVLDIISRAIPVQGSYSHNGRAIVSAR